MENVSITDRKFLSINILMGHVKRDKTRDYWSTNKLIETPIFSKLMSRNRFEQIWNFWHYSNNSTLVDEADRLENRANVLGKLVAKCSNYKLPQELSLDKAMISW
jgi:hypothetical protein